MKKIIFFLFFLLPLVQAVAVTPTNLDFGVLERGEDVSRELLVVNNGEEKLDYRIRGVYNDDFVLDPGERILLTVKLEVVDKEDGKYEDVIRVEEIVGMNLVNAITIKVKYKVKGGDFSSEYLDFENVKTKKQKFPYLYVVVGVFLLSLGVYGVFSKKKV